VLDEKTGDFTESPFDRAPYTHAIVDTRLELVAIARKYELAPTPDRLCDALARVLSASTAGQQGRARFSCSLLSNPDRFLSSLRNAFAVRSFTVTFTPPNPFDVDGDFILPMERLVRAAEGDRGSATLKGAALNPAPLQEISRSAAATGDNATARIIEEEGEKPVTRSLRGDSVSVSADALDSPEERAAVIAKARTEYGRIREDQGDEVA
jgi:hypothetical protein